MDKDFLWCISILFICVAIYTTKTEIWELEKEVQEIKNINIECKVED